jgi:Retinoic acid induced 16-like protein
LPGISSQEWSGHRYFGWSPQSSDCSIDVLGTLVRLSESDRPAGIQAEVLRAVSNMVVLLDEQFLVHSAVHKAVLRLLRNCVGDDLQEQLDGRSKLMGAARNVTRSQPSEYEEDCKAVFFPF